ncbi:centrin-3-like [Stigmatopora argus]
MRCRHTGASERASERARRSGRFALRPERQTRPLESGTTMDVVAEDGDEDTQPQTSASIESVPEKKRELSDILVDSGMLEKKIDSDDEDAVWEKKKALSEAQKVEIREAFELFDADKDNKIDYHELKLAMRALGLEVKKGNVMQIINDFDHDESGKIKFEDFREVATELMLDRDPKEEILKAFRLFDDDESGAIGLRKLKRVARELGLDTGEEELRSMISAFDTDGDGEINQEEFLCIMRGLA